MGFTHYGTRVHYIDSGPDFNRENGRLRGFLGGVMNGLGNSVDWMTVRGPLVAS